MLLRRPATLALAQRPALGDDVTCPAFKFAQRDPRLDSLPNALPVNWSIDERPPCSNELITDDGTRGGRVAKWAVMVTAFDNRRSSRRISGSQVSAAPG